MDLLKKTQDLCRMYGIKPARSKGQNFLISELVYDRIIEAAELKPDDTVVEVGPGLGFLTAKLAARAGRVIAVELDDKLAELLSVGLKAKGVENVEVINTDIMKMENGNWKLGNTNFKFQISNFKVVANIPYNITSALIRKFLTAEKKPSLLVLMVQKEVGERIIAKPPRMSKLAVSVQYYGEPSIVEHVSAKNFWPQPEVDSCILKIVTRICGLNADVADMRITRDKEGSLDSACAPLGMTKGGHASLPIDPVPPTHRTPAGMIKEDGMENGYAFDKKFFQMVNFGFSSKRKMLKNNLAAGYRIKQADAENFIVQAGFDSKTRAQELSVDDWKKMFEVIRQNML